MELQSNYWQIIFSNVTGTGVTWNNDGTGSFIPSTSDGSASITIETKVDDVIWYDNSFIFNSTGYFK